MKALHIFLSLTIWFVLSQGIVCDDAVPAGEPQVLDGAAEGATESEVQGLQFDADVTIDEMKTAAVADNVEQEKRETPETGLNPSYIIFNKMVARVISYFIDSEKILDGIQALVLSDTNKEKVRICLSKNKQLQQANVTALLESALTCSHGIIDKVKPNVEKLVKALKQGYDLLTDIPIRIRNCTSIGKVEEDKKTDEDGENTEAGEKTDTTDTGDEAKDSEAPARRRKRGFWKTFEKVGKKTKEIVIEAGKKVGEVVYKVVKLIQRGGKAIIRLIQKGYAKFTEWRLGNRFTAVKKFGCIALTTYAIGYEAADLISGIIPLAQDTILKVKQLRTNVRKCLKEGVLKNCKLEPPKAAKDPKLKDFKIIEDDQSDY